MSDSIPLKYIELVDALLPQTQCQKCGFNGCMPYAEAIVRGEPVNRCSPGGTKVIEQLALLLEREVLPVDAGSSSETAHRVVIREADCIGCTKCIQACPVDAIIGSAKQMHTVMASDCTGCDLCIAPCPVDCIETVPLSQREAEALLTDERRAYNRQLYMRHTKRLAQQTRVKALSRRMRAATGQMVAQSTTMNKKLPVDNHKLVLNALLGQKRKLMRQREQCVDVAAKNQLTDILAQLEKKIKQQQGVPTPKLTAKIKNQSVQQAVWRAKMKKLQRQYKESLASGNNADALVIGEKMNYLQDKINALIS